MYSAYMDTSSEYMESGTQVVVESDFSSNCLSSTTTSTPDDPDYLNPGTAPGFNPRRPENRARKKGKVKIRFKKRRRGTNPNANSSPSSTQPHRCVECSKGFSSPGKLSQHMYLHTGERPYQCGQCSKAFSSKFKLVRHALIHSADRKHKCSFCERCFHRKDHLKNHLKVHSPNKKVYCCEKCGKEYNSQLSFRKHIAVHSAEAGDPECKICQMRFPAKEELLFHLKVHAGSRTVKSPSEKKFKCEFCERRFFTRKDVKRHLVVHTGRRDFLCQFCPQRFGRKDHLVRHIKKSHGGGSKGGERKIREDSESSASADMPQLVAANLIESTDSLTQCLQPESLSQACGFNNFVLDSAISDCSASSPLEPMLVTKRELVEEDEDRNPVPSPTTTGPVTPFPLPPPQQSYPQLPLFADAAIKSEGCDDEDGTTDLSLPVGGVDFTQFLGFLPSSGGANETADVGEGSGTFDSALMSLLESTQSPMMADQIMDCPGANSASAVVSIAVTTPVTSPGVDNLVSSTPLPRFSQAFHQ